MAEAGTITMKLVLDTTEAEAKIAALRKSAEGLNLSVSDSGALTSSINVVLHPGDHAFTAAEVAAQIIKNATAYKNAALYKNL